MYYCSSIKNCCKIQVAILPSTRTAWRYSAVLYKQVFIKHESKLLQNTVDFYNCFHTLYLRIQIRSLLHQSPDTKPETIPNSEIILQNGEVHALVVAAQHCISHVFAFVHRRGRSWIVIASNSWTVTSVLFTAVFRFVRRIYAGQQAVVAEFRFLPFDGREPRHDPHSDRDQRVWQEEVEPDVAGQGGEKGEMPAL